MEMRWTRSERGRTYYWISKNDRDSGRALIFLHGLTADHRMFAKQTESFSPEYTVIAWDAPAHGKSRPYRDFTYAHLAAELSQILTAETIRKVVLIGQSMGGFAAQSFMTAHPDMVEGFVSIDSCPYGTVYYSKADFFWLKQIKWMARCYPDRLLRSAMAKLCGITAAARTNMRTMLKCYTKAELCNLMHLGFAGFIPEVHDLKIPCPVCLLLGEYDRTGKVRQYNEHWHRRENYPLHIIKNAAHNANEDNPAEVNAIIKGFLREIGWESLVCNSTGSTGGKIDWHS